MTAYAPFPSQPPAADPTDVVGRRILAYVLDILIMGLASAALIIPLFQSISVTQSASEARCSEFDSSSSDGFDDRQVITDDLCLEINDDIIYIPTGEEGTFTQQVYAISFGLQALNLILLQGLVGASLGKLMVGLRVIREDGSKAGLGWALLRWVVLLIDSFCCFLPGLALVFTTKGHRRLGDMLASTFVVRSSAVGTPPVVPGVTAPTWDAPQPGAWGAPPQVGAWGTPDATPQGWTPPPVAAPATPTSDGPTWDDARNTYIQYDRDRSEWVQWDAATSQWRPIDQ